MHASEYSTNSQSKDSIFSLVPVARHDHHCTKKSELTFWFEHRTTEFSENALTADAKGIKVRGCFELYSLQVDLISLI